MSKSVSSLEKIILSVVFSRESAPFEYKQSNFAWGCYKRVSTIIEVEKKKKGARENDSSFYSLLCDFVSLLSPSLAGDRKPLDDRPW